MIISLKDYLEHFGTPRRSGRYPWGSGGDPQHSKDFLAYVKDLNKQGLTEVQIAEGLGINTKELRAQKALAKNAATAADIAMVQRLKEKGYSNVEIGKRIGRGESYVRSLLREDAKEKNDVLLATSESLKRQIEEKGLIQIGSGVEHHMNISANKLDNAVSVLKEQGYRVGYVKVDQLGTGHETSVKILIPPGMTNKEVYQNRDKIQLPFEYTQDGGKTFHGPLPPLNIDSKRIAVKYADKGGADEDGLMYVRPGVDDVSIGSSRYAQVRVGVDGTHYLKGMAVYKDDLPPGVDILYHSNKLDTGNKHDAMKPMDDDPNNPFGGAIIKRQLTKPDSKGNDKVTSAMNILNEEGNWDKWNKSLSAQMLSKQNPSLAKQQLAAVHDRRRKELDTIKALTNPEVKKKLLEEFADNTDSTAVHLDAAALPRQSTHVILPIPKMRETEVYAPNYHNGERVALVRFPHGGIFEIPELTVNNRQPQAKALIGQAKDAIGIHPKVAEKLSGADFDGDFVLVIPNNTGAVKTAPSLEGLKNFDPKKAYKAYPGMKPMSEHYKQTQMGEVSNLVTDMTIRGASPDEIARAVRHSMVVIDAVKHNLNYKQSFADNGIAALKARYQSGGASTLVSRANSKVDVPQRRPRPQSKGGSIDPKTGEKIWEETGKTYTTKDGRLVKATQKSKRLAETNDAHSLSSGTPIEKIYADHSNSLKAMANEARKEYLTIKPRKQSSSAKEVYRPEMDSLTSKLKLAQRNAPLERQAMIIGNASYRARVQANPGFTKDQKKKIKQQELARARAFTQARKQEIDITDAEWAAIQSGALSSAKIKDILRYANPDRVRKLATPRTKPLMSSTKTQRAKAMMKSGKTQAEIAAALGVSLTTLKLALNEG